MNSFLPSTNCPESFLGQVLLLVLGIAQCNKGTEKDKSGPLGAGGLVSRDSGQQTPISVGANECSGE